MTTTTVTSPKTNLADEGFARVPEAAEFLRVSRATVYKLMDNRGLRYAKIGKSRRIPWRCLREFAERCVVR
jgi:excisionase family DNA binding protein